MFTKEYVKSSDIEIKRRGIYLCDLGRGVGSEQGGIRPVLVTKNQKGVDNSPVITVVPITSKTNKGVDFTHVHVGVEFGLDKDSDIQIEQTRTVDKKRFVINGEIKKYGEVTEEVMSMVKTALLRDNDFIDVHFNREEAFKICRLIANLQKINSPYIEENKNDLKKRLVNYCNQYNKDYKEVMHLYNNRVQASRISNINQTRVQACS